MQNIDRTKQIQLKVNYKRDYKKMSTFKYHQKIFSFMIKKKLMLTEIYQILSKKSVVVKNIIMKCSNLLIIIKKDLLNNQLMSLKKKVNSIQNLRKKLKIFNFICGGVKTKERICKYSNSNKRKYRLINNKINSVKFFDKIFLFF